MKKKKKKFQRRSLYLSSPVEREIYACRGKRSLLFEDREILVEVRETVTHKFSRLLSLVYASSVFHCNLSRKWRWKRFFDVGVENDI